MKHLNLSLLILLIIFCAAPISTTWASAVPVEQVVSTQTKVQKRAKMKRLKRFKKHKKNYQKKFKQSKQQQGRGLSWIWWLLIIWYVISIALLITGLALAFPPLWIAAVVLLLFPLFVTLVLGIIFIIMLYTTPWG